ncbi:hypothetical protein [Actinacidiphila acidipaludis]|uniref:hypothetical protein n=1 Tax=Actinacidiphila acidipaludis TaxID=2873382 RepID=UPI0027DF3726|nr:hypothetical protein [Streptomyces acidipaludis]
MTQTHALHQLVPLAAELDDNKVTPGLLGFVIFAVIAVALYALMKNMGKQMKKIDFDEKTGTTGTAEKADGVVPGAADRAPKDTVGPQRSAKSGGA